MEYTCKLCGSEIYGNRKKLKGGYICPKCYNVLPLGVRSSISSFTPKQIQQIKRITFKPQFNQEKVWRSCGEFKVCTSFIVLNGIEYKLKDLRDVRFNFHPKEVGREPNTVVGVPTIVIETKSPHIILEETFTSELILLKYTISDMNITYHYSPALNQIIGCIREALQSRKYYIAQAYEESQHRDYSKQKAQEKKRQQQNNQPATPLEKALKLYGLQQPFSKDSLKKRRHDLLKAKAIHPDNGGTNEKFKEFKDAYILLLKFAVG